MEREDEEKGEEEQEKGRREKLEEEGGKGEEREGWGSEGESSYWPSDWKNLDKNFFFLPGK